MAKKKSKPAGDSSKPPKRPKSAPKRPSRQIPKEMEALLRQLQGLPPEGDDDGPRSRAETLLHRAFNSDDPAEVVKLANKALEQWPDCADAYGLLAEASDTPREALLLYHEAVAAAERELGPQFFRDNAGYFWGVIETRPYMRARLELANTLWNLGRREEALDHYREMLRLNPGDNQGIRYILATGLLDAGLDDELTELLGRFEGEASAYWSYSAALLAFRREGNSPGALAKLAEATSRNPHVPSFISGREPLPPRMPGMYEMGTKSEAVLYASAALSGWRGTPGAIDWVRRSTGKKSAAGARKTSGKAKAKGPTPLVKKRLAGLPQAGDVWQADVRLLPIWLNAEDSPIRPWVILVVNRTEDLVLAQEISEELPGADVIWTQLVKAMQKPAMGSPHRPSEIQVRNAPQWDDLEPHLDDLHVRRTVFENLDLMDNVFGHLISHLSGGGPEVGLLDMPGVRPPQVAAFFRSAASFYRAAPWRRVPGEDTIKVECEQFESGPWYAVVIGQMGVTPGLALYEDFQMLARMRANDADDEQNARDTVALSVTFGERIELSFPDLDAATEHGWEIAAPEAYPSAMRKERGMVMRPPLGWELQLLEATLSVIPTFLTEHPRDSAGPFRRDVPTSVGPLSLSLSWQD